MKDILFGCEILKIQFNFIRPEVFFSNSFLAANSLLQTDLTNVLAISTFPRSPSCSLLCAGRTFLLAYPQSSLFFILSKLSVYSLIRSEFLSLMA